jgi:hypothetical protein
MSLDDDKDSDWTTTLNMKQTSFHVIFANSDGI